MRRSGAVLVEGQGCSRGRWWIPAGDQVGHRRRQASLRRPRSGIKARARARVSSIAIERWRKGVGEIPGARARVGNLFLSLVSRNSSEERMERLLLTRSYVYILFVIKGLKKKKNTVCKALFRLFRLFRQKIGSLVLGEERGFTHLTLVRLPRVIPPYSSGAGTGGTESVTCWY